MQPPSTNPSSPTSNNALPDLGTACPPTVSLLTICPRIVQRKRPIRGARMSACGSEELGADEQRAYRICRLHSQHRVPGRALKTAYGVSMERSKLHPLN